MRTRLTRVLLLASLLLLAACSKSLAPMVPVTDLPPEEEPTADMANPASVFCEEQGGTVDIRVDEEGNQTGFCVFSDGIECDEWAYFRGECEPESGSAAGMANPASVFCEEQGGTVDIRTEDDGGQIGICVFPDGSECEEWAFLRTECAPGAEASATGAPTETEGEPTAEPTTATAEAEAGGTTVYLPGVVTLQSFDYADWQTYRNMAYGFSFRFPPDWHIQEVTDPEDTMARHRVTLSDLDEPLATLHIAFKTADEDQQIAPTGIGAGEITDRGSLPFLGEELPRRALVAEGKDFGVLYGGESEVTRGELVFWMGLNYVGDPATDPGLSPEFQTLVDQIVTSLQIEP